MADKLLVETIEGIRALQADAALPAEQWDYRTRPGIELRKKAAENALPEALAAYKKLLEARILAVVVGGPGAEKFARLAEAEFGCLAFPADALYRDSTGFVRSMVADGELFSTSVVMGLTKFLRDVALSLKLDRVVAPTMDADLLRQVDNDETLLGLVRTSIDRGAGPAFNMMYLTDMITEKAAAAEYALPVLPVVLFAPGKPEGLSFARQFETAAPNEDFGKDTVEKGLVAARQQFGIGGEKEKRTHKKREVAVVADTKETTETEQN